MAQTGAAPESHQHTKTIHIHERNGSYTVNKETLNVKVNDNVEFINHCEAAVQIQFTLNNQTTPTPTVIDAGGNHTFQAQVVGTVTYAISAATPGANKMPGDDPYTIIVGSSGDEPR